MPLDATLHADAGRDGVDFAFHVTNAGPEEVVLTFQSGMAADVGVFEGDEEVWRWSEGRMFTQALRDVALGAGETVTYELTWSEPVSGTYRAVGTLAADPDARAETTFTV